MTVTISVRPYGGTYIARVIGTNFEASCTASEFVAATRAAKKAFGQRQFLLNAVTDSTFEAKQARDCKPCEGHGYLQGSSGSHTCDECKGLGKVAI